MTILTYIIPNILIILMLLCGVLKGQKLGWKKAFTKLGYTIGLSVGTFFLSAHVITPGLANLFGEAGLIICFLPTFIWLLTFGVFMGIAEVIFTVVANHLDLELRENKIALREARRADITKKSKEVKMEEKAIAKAQRHAFKQHRREQLAIWLAEHKLSRILGGIAGFLQYTLISIMVIMLASHTVSTLMLLPDIKEEAKETMVTIDECYDHSVFGIIDNLANKDNEEGTLEDRLLVEELTIVVSHLDTQEEAE